ncbi:HK97 gp10 family phage protein [Paenibacillus glycanilyticus]|uniref:HK97 gp10 family phage protein n=1 Tax=Paenibacillus glycanilyticus TaxID=126569 RepID=UPI00191101E9|nr:HK97 gp10 family phage protein [Paenibacillus glycanilyticus]
MAKGFKIEGMAELERMMRRLNKIPSSAVTKPAKAGAKIALKQAKADAPEDTGELKKGIVLKAEKYKKLKRVYDIIINPKKNGIFVKMSKAGDRSYYPASQEFGFMTKDGEYVPGYNYMQESLPKVDKAVQKTILDTAIKEVEKIMKG